MSDKAAEENVVFLNDEKIRVEDFSDEQGYFHSQILDLRNKRGRLTFEIDQVSAALKVFENSFLSVSKKKAEGVLGSKQ
jgi:hypothetical protein|tara:strand:- start:3408 stop:3644 length:237 start_codon:yes stop_codon:yes gene_type:complete